jgi:hypothetical protein
MLLASGESCGLCFYWWWLRIDKVVVLEEEKLLPRGDWDSISSMGDCSLIASL